VTQVRSGGTWKGTDQDARAEKESAMNLNCAALVLAAATGVVVLAGTPAAAAAAAAKPWPDPPGNAAHPW
jgi:hypothetical protein